MAIIVEKVVSQAVDTDTYAIKGDIKDITGKVVAQGDVEHVTKEHLLTQRVSVAAKLAIIDEKLAAIDAVEADK